MSAHKQSWILILPNETFKLNETISLQKDDIHYLQNVLRLKQNDSVEISNGNGTKAVGKIIELTHHKAHLTVTELKEFEKPNINIHLLLAQLKPNALEEAIKLTSEIGISSIHIFPSERNASKQPIKIEKLEKIAQESIRISKNPFLTDVNVYKSFDECLSEIQRNFKNTSFIFCDEESKELIYQTQTSSTKNIFILIGPEASFSVKEREKIKSLPNLHTVSLGSHILRAPTAAVCASYIMLQKHMK